jgi:hypothetical protein
VGFGAVVLGGRDEVGEGQAHQSHDVDGGHVLAVRVPAGANSGQLTVIIWVGYNIPE